MQSLRAKNKMRKILLPIFILVVIAITMGTTSSCTPESKHTDTLDSAVIKPTVDALADTAHEGAKTTTALSVTGKVVDGAMNSVFVEVKPDSAVEFSYPQLDRNNPDVFYNWAIDDMITITYTKITRGNEEVDSVISIKKAS